MVRIRVSAGCRSDASSWPTSNTVFAVAVLGFDGSVAVPGKQAPHARKEWDGGKASEEGSSFVVLKVQKVGEVVHQLVFAGCGVSHFVESQCNQW